MASKNTLVARRNGSKRYSKLAGIFLALVMCSSAQAQTKDEAILLRRSDVLPPNLLQGGPYKVVDVVKNDGLINTYQVSSNYGNLTIESTALLKKRLRELVALERMEHLKKSDLFVDALKRSAVAPVKAVKSLVTDPIETTEGVVTGVGRWFRNVGSAITSKEPREDTVVERTAGHSRAKRQFAFEYGVDPYSPFPPLQEALDDIAWPAAGGSLTVTAALVAVPGAVLTLAVTTNTERDMKALVRDSSPSELRRINKQKLEAMGVPENLAEYFLFNRAYGPEEQTILVGELDTMVGVSDRRLFIEKAAGAVDEPTAIFHRTQAQMFASYHARIAKVARCIDAAGVVFLEKEDGTIVGLFPFDHMVWTAEVSQKSQAIATALKEKAAQRKLEFWLLGTVDPSAQEGLTAAGWKVTPKAGDRLFVG